MSSQLTFGELSRILSSIERTIAGSMFALPEAGLSFSVGAPGLLIGAVEGDGITGFRRAIAAEASLDSMSLSILLTSPASLWSYSDPLRSIRTYLSAAKAF